MQKKYKINKQYVLEEIGNMITSLAGSAKDVITKSDLNSTRDKLVNNAGLLGGGLLAGGAMFNHMLGDPTNDIGADIIGAGVLGAAGAGAGSIIHNQIKKNNSQVTQPSYREEKYY